MQPNLQKSASDDEDDLESLRLAALQSLKRPTTSNLNAGNPNNSLKLFNKKLNKRRFIPCRTNRNGTFNNRIRNTTLITVTTVDTDSSNDVKKVDVAPKLILPQDRYCNTKPTAEEKSEISSKFDRYDNSDSDSDSDSHDENSTPPKLERSDSLEALMQELENELHGDMKSKEDVGQKPKKIRKVRKTKDEIGDTPIVVEEVEEPPKEEPVKVTVKSPKQLHRKRRVENCVQQNKSNLVYTNTTTVPFQTMPYTSYTAPLCPPVPFETQMPYYPIAPPPLICVNDLNPPQPVFTKYENPLPPLKLNTDVLNTISAPLSPRSAAFVLQNREIIERRKKSPRRSYSRSPSPRYRRSNSRSVSPVRRLSPKNRRAQTYKRSSPSSISRYNQASPKRIRKSPPRNVRSLSKEKVTDKSPSISLSPSPERFVTNESKDDDTLDPVLEARRKKFENGAVPTEGIIRLRPKNEGNEEAVVSSTKDETEEVPEDSVVDEPEEELLVADDAIDLNLKMDDLFSDEESDSENEGRFKLKQNSPRVVPIKPFNRIANGIGRSNASGEKSHRSKPYDKEKRYDRDRRRSRSPVSKDKPARSEKEPDGIKSLMSLKIDNPRKKTSESKSAKHADEQSEDVKEKKSSARKVEVAVVEACIVHEDSDADDDVANGSGDLRAQLSRKRAERQQMLPKTEKIPSRLLQNALESAVFKKLKKSKRKDKDLASVDGKLPIHLRLGIPGSFNVNEPKVQKKSSGKRSKSRAKYEQV